MRKLTFLNVAFIFLVVNSCAYRNITFGTKHKQNKTEQAINSDNSEDILLSDDILPSPNPDKKTKKASQKESRSLPEFIDQKIVKHIDEDVSFSSNELIQKLDKKRTVLKNSKIVSRRAGEDSKNGTLLVILGSVFLILGALAVVAAVNLLDKADSETAEGCVTAIFGGIMLVTLGIILGVTGLVFLIIGIVFFARNN